MDNVHNVSLSNTHSVMLAKILPETLQMLQEQALRKETVPSLESKMEREKSNCLCGGEISELKAISLSV